ncbi:MAG TPA: hypothetical protein VFQ95_08215 [Rhodanobacteraceae bacterium]|nr:hypothetical protein [Rhodanobacteraceae bacterium]
MAAVFTDAGRAAFRAVDAALVAGWCTIGLRVREMFNFTGFAAFTDLAGFARFGAGLATRFAAARAGALRRAGATASVLRAVFAAAPAALRFRGVTIVAFLYVVVLPGSHRPASTGVAAVSCNGCPAAVCRTLQPEPSVRSCDGRGGRSPAKPQRGNAVLSALAK